MLADTQKSEGFVPNLIRVMAEAFFRAGYGTREYLEVVVGVTMKTLSNYVNHAANTPLDAAFQTAKWAA